jgi:hypothetical protein
MQMTFVTAHLAIARNASGQQFQKPFSSLGKLRAGTTQNFQKGFFAQARCLFQSFAWQQITQNLYSDIGGGIAHAFVLNVFDFVRYHNTANTVGFQRVLVSS